VITERIPRSSNLLPAPPPRSREKLAPQAQQVYRNLDQVVQGRLIVDKVYGPTCSSAGLLAGRAHLIGTSGTLVGGDPWVPMSLTKLLLTRGVGRKE
jgi:hypothetical protein